MKEIALITTIFLIIFTANAQIIHVPADQISIQSGIDAAKDGDTVLISDGTYFEQISFIGKAITVASNFILDGDTDHILKTIIDGSQAANPDSNYVVYFDNNEDSSSVLMGLTLKYKALRKTGSNEVIGGAVYFGDSHPKVLNYKIVGQIENQKAKTKPKTYITWVYMIPSSKKIKGCLYSVNDSTLTIIPDTYLKQGSSYENETVLVNAKLIEKIYIRQKGSKTVGVIIGTISGLFTGIIVGTGFKDDTHSCYNDPICVKMTAQQKTILLTVPLALIGGGAGLLLGSKKIKIYINGHMSSFEKNGKELKKYAVRKE